MDLRQVERLAQQGEGLTIEFKKKAAHPEKIVREIIALANTKGGYLLLGVDDDGTVSGHKYIEEEIYALDKAIQEMISPPIQVITFKLEVSQKKGVAIYEVPRSKDRPHYLWENNRKKAFIRVEDKSIQASREMWQILKRQQWNSDIVFKYGRKEEILVKALEQKQSITLQEYMKLAKIPVYMASKTLVKLVLANVLEVIPKEYGDVFVMKSPH
ncbi:AlbA family DNA-binding domain-containing protein [Pleomorphovibrio marinus]|uniref:AlbA family DNA-binding domain-containing protein n=1 Tax=Pleomorphovibrio marinus TaxID=2164132 RepID=UPI000E0CBA97|nr:ATP-binding protein [Pleomorphovibrio marinus]